MKIRRKTNQCFNCGYTLDQVYNYCPNCGQENNDNNVSFGTLVGDFFSTYFAVDGTFGRSVMPFFFKPGFLTNRYIAGQRVSYAHPLRLYLIISLFYFFVFAMVGKKIVADQGDNQSIIDSSYSLSDIDGLDRETRKKLRKLVPKETLTKMKDGLEGEDLKDLQKVVQDNLSQEDIESLKSELTPSQLVLLGIFVPDSLLADSQAQDSLTITDTAATEPAKAALTGKESKVKNTSIFEQIDWKLISNLKDNGKISDQQILDSMDLKNPSPFEEHIAMQSIRVMRAGNEQIVDYILNNLPLMMLILIPIFAFTLKILYVRRKKELYIHHLIHGLHLHSFAYLAYGLSLLLMIYGLKNESMQTTIGFIGFFIVSTYAYFSFLRVYRQNWLKTLIKFNIAGFIYISCISIFLVCEMLLSMLFY